MFPIIAKIAEVAKEVAASAEEMHISEAVMEDMKAGLAQAREAEASMSNMSSVEGMKQLEANAKYIKDGQLYTTDSNGVAKLVEGKTKKDVIASETEKASMDATKTTAENIEAQNAAISRFENKGIRNLDSHELGKYGEMKTDQDMRRRGFERISKDMITDETSELKQGLDGVYYRKDGIPQYALVEAKFGNSQLRETVRDGMQMSDKWIDNRLDDAVGKEMADEIRLQQLLNPDNVARLEARVNYSGEVTYSSLDSFANVIERGIEL